MVDDRRFRILVEVESWEDANPILLGKASTEDWVSTLGRLRRHSSANRLTLPKLPRVEIPAGFRCQRKKGGGPGLEHFWPQAAEPSEAPQATNYQLASVDKGDKVVGMGSTTSRPQAIIVGAVPHSLARPFCRGCPNFSPTPSSGSKGSGLDSRPPLLPSTLGSIRSAPSRRSLRLAAKHKGSNKSSLIRAQETMCKKFKLVRFAAKSARPPPSSSTHSSSAATNDAVPVGPMNGTSLLLEPSTLPHPAPPPSPSKDPAFPLTQLEIQQILESCGVMSKEGGTSNVVFSAAPGSATDVGAVQEQTLSFSLLECKRVDLKPVFFQELREICGRSVGAWAVLGDFNTLLSLSDKNGQPSNPAEILLFRDTINDIGLADLPLRNRAYTWSNGRRNPTLERLDRALVSLDWLRIFPSFSLKALPRPRSDHCPLLLTASTFVPQSGLFRFEAFWLRCPSFGQLVTDAWNFIPPSAEPVTRLSEKLRKVCQVLSSWSSGRTSLLRKQADSCLLWIGWLDSAEEGRQLSHLEFALRLQLKAIANHLLSFYSSQLGVVSSTSRTIHFLSLFAPDTLDLSTLSFPFTMDEVKTGVFSCAPDKAPGPDGFPMLFFQRFWHTLKDDIFDVFSSFYDGPLNLSDINKSWICPIPKKATVETARDLRPISLIHSVTKIISKVLATRLQLVMDKLVNPFQTAFIKGRHILDNFYTAHILIHHLHSSKHKAALLKIDFERAFDHINWDFLFQLLSTRGFGAKWIDWIKGLLLSTSSAVLLNGTPGSSFVCKRGLRQGDPLSPLLFIMCTDVLFRMIDAATSSGHLPTVGIGEVSIHTLQFADDILIFFDGSRKSAAVIKVILDAFSDSSGLKINFNKSALIPLHLTDDQAADLSTIFGCSTQHFPFSYLGLPLSPKRLLKADYLPIIEKIDARLAGWKGATLSRGHRKSTRTPKKKKEKEKPTLSISSHLRFLSPTLSKPNHKPSNVLLLPPPPLLLPTHLLLHHHHHRPLTLLRLHRRTLAPPLSSSSLSSYKVTIEHEGSVQTLDVAPDETILERALEEGLSVPHDCKLGVCMTCPARLLAGAVDQSEGMLSDDVVARGYALLCASYPRSDCRIRTIPEDELLSLQLATAND
uniref:Reverse transcriptase domain-containing protein n=1 Tax=Ananas comosus var. bracteatus TaxID=296719 RepID=A0A6V7PB39_ANACO|nr:unnamed protein product [Ananas comosus var. bracteatus]